MRILLGSYAFFPDVGGIETASMTLAVELTARGHEVVVLTFSKREAVDDDLPFQVIRLPSGRETWRAYCRAEAVIQNNPSLRSGWPMVFLRGLPWVVVIATWISRPDGSMKWRDHVKRWSLRGAKVVAVSQFVADKVGLEATVVPNSYDSAVFHENYGVRRTKDVVFVGRLVSDKGLDVLLEAIALLADEGHRVGLTIVGAGPERPSLESLARHLGVSTLVTFAGVLRGPLLAEKLNEHRVIAVPSTWAEPFGIVALEGLACGCRPVVAQTGGLPEAAGPTALTFAAGDPNELASQLAEALSPGATDMGAVERHLRLHSPALMVTSYLELVASAGAKQARDKRRQ